MHQTTTFKVMTSVPKKELFGCTHYERKCSFVSPCCKCIFPCRLCHDEKITSHSLDRHAVQEIVCMLCNVQQPVAERCKSCDTQFGKYFCVICRLYDDREKGQFHCDLCGICRIGGKENFHHCQTCGFCLAKSQAESHKCIENNSKSNCPVCLEDIHTSRNPAHMADCGHLMHSDCYTELLKAGDFRCPICGVSTVVMKYHWKMLDEEINQTPMPEEYANVKQWILCKDCQKTTETIFHVLGCKCGNCGSYNTCGTDTPAANITT